MNFYIITLFPHALDSYLSESILKRAIDDKKIKVKFYNPRDFAENKHDRVDRKPYGGGPGMVIQALPVVKAIESALKDSRFTIHDSRKRSRAKGQGSKVSVVWLSPSGKQFTNEYAKKLAGKRTDIIIICGRYEGIDVRVKKVLRTASMFGKVGVEEISVGPFVLTGGELPAEILIDVISRQVPGVLGDFTSLEESRVSSSDVYTRPEVFEYRGKKFRVPKILLSGHRAKIDQWKMKQKM